VIDSEAQKIGVGPAPDCTHTEIAAPAPGDVIQEKASGMARSAKQWLSGQVERIEGEWLFEDLSGSVVIGECEGDTGCGATLKLHLRSVRHGFVDVLILSREGCGIENGEIDLVAKQVVVVSGGEGVFSGGRIPLRRRGSVPIADQD
jgi:hypothetical protein